MTCFFADLVIKEGSRKIWRRMRAVRTEMISPPLPVMNLWHQVLYTVWSTSKRKIAGCACLQGLVFQEEHMSVWHGILKSYMTVENIVHTRPGTFLDILSIGWDALWFQQGFFLFVFFFCIFSLFHWLPVFTKFGCSNDKFSWMASLFEIGLP